jgi:hypothetical protein
MDIGKQLLAGVRSADETERIQAVVDVLLQAETYARTLRQALAGFRRAGH